VSLSGGGARARRHLLFTSLFFALARSEREKKGEERTRAFPITYLSLILPGSGDQKKGQGWEKGGEEMLCATAMRVNVLPLLISSVLSITGEEEKKEKEGEHLRRASPPFPTIL